MLKYFKRQRNRLKGDDNETEVDAVDSTDDHVEIGADAANAVIRRSKRISSLDGSNRHSWLSNTSSFCDEIFEAGEVAMDGCEEAEALGFSLITGQENIFAYHSRLSMTLSSIVNDPNCLSYFVQYLETCRALPLIKFYLDTENFKRAAKSQILTNPTQTVGDVSAEETESIGSHARSAYEMVEGDDDVDVADPAENRALLNEENDNNVPELKTLCDLSMRKPLTDDEKSQIYAETNKYTSKAFKVKPKAGPFTKEKLNSSQLSLSSQATELSYSANNHLQISESSIRDAIAIYQKYLIPNAEQFVSLPVNILSEISLLLCQRNDDDAKQDDVDGGDAKVSAECFSAAQQYVLEQLEYSYLNDFLQSQLYSKYCLELMEDGVHAKIEEKLTIFDILYSEVTLFFFMEYLEQHGDRESLDFWSAAIHFRKSSLNGEGQLNRPESEVQADAMIIYEKFFSLQSDSRLWLSDRLRSYVEERICAKGRVSFAFDLPLLITAKYLERKHFANFIKSQLFENYINDLRVKLQGEQPASSQATVDDDCVDAVSISSQISQRLSLKRAKAPHKHRKTLSDCSLHRHISQQNTLLAMPDSYTKNLSIDSSQLTNPDLLWQRRYSVGSNCPVGNRSGGLKFGHINALGRYERDFEYVDVNGGGVGGLVSGKHQWSLAGNKFKNAMRKLVNLPEERVQEEIAWQVAEMIVKDVTSVTMNGNGANAAQAANKERQG